jgi:hypothetical protein
MASNVTGIPAAGVTGVLPVGVTGGSGLTALGTVATGNLSNSAIVYPAGHVIQVTSATINTTVVNTTESANVSLLTKDITPKRTTSEILIVMNFHMGNWNPNGALALTYQPSGGSATSLANAGGSYGGGSGFFVADDTHGSIYTLDSYGFNFLHDHNVSAGTPITYLLRTDSSTTVYFNRSVQSSSGWGSSTMTLIEIAT